MGSTGTAAAPLASPTPSCGCSRAARLTYRPCSSPARAIGEPISARQFRAHANSACTRRLGVYLVDGAGHWVLPNPSPQRSAKMPTQICLTVDIEFSIGGAFAAPADRPSGRHLRCRRPRAPSRFRARHIAVVRPLGDFLRRGPELLLFRLISATGRGGKLPSASCWRVMTAAAPASLLALFPACRLEDPSFPRTAEQFLCGAQR